MRANAPVYYDEANDLWAAASYAAVKQASVDTESFSNAGGIRPKFPPLPMMIDFDAPEHVRRRRLVSEGFTPKRVRAMEDKLRVGLRRHHRPGLRGGQLRLRPRHRGPAAHHHDRRHARRRARRPRRPAAVVRRHAQGPGLPRPRRAWRTRRTRSSSTPSTSIPSSTTGVPRGNTDDLVGVLCHAEIDGDSLDDDSLVHETLLILIGGDETTRHVISGGVEELLAHPDQAARLAADPDGLHAGRGRGDAALGVADQEHGPDGHPRRRAGRGARIRAGQELLLLYPSANRDEAVFERRGRASTSRAAPTRTWPSASAPTSAWATSWPAWSCAVMVERVLARLPDLHLAVERAALPRRPANFISGIEEMPVAFTPERPGGRRARLMADRRRAPAGIAGWSILVTGGGSGIGLATAERLAADGAHVTICGRTEQKLADATARIAAGGDRWCDRPLRRGGRHRRGSGCRRGGGDRRRDGPHRRPVRLRRRVAAPRLDADRRRGRGARHHRPQPDGLGDLREAGRGSPCRPRVAPAPSC